VPKTKTANTKIDEKVRPDWVNETPDETSYALQMNDQNFQPEQEIHLTRGEYVRLKRWLAALRGYDLETPLDQWRADSLKNKPQSNQEYEKIAITQEEIQMVIDLEEVANFLVKNLRRRLKEGARVDPGKWELDDDGSEITETHLLGSTRDGLSIRQPLASGAGS